MAPDPTNGQPFSLLVALFADPAMTETFSEAAAVRGWLDAEAALAWAQARAGVISDAEGRAIEAACVPESVDLAVLRSEARNVGYPILPLVRMIDAAVEEGARGRVHLGATTQDIMDTGLVLQLRAALGRLDALVSALGDTLGARVEEHRHTLIAARTHAQQAVPTTFGVKLAVYLAELARQRDRLDAVADRVATVSLHGAGGTSAALGERASEVRRLMAERLGLAAEEVPWHVARDSIAEFGLTCGLVAATCARFAREVVDLSRTEVGELAEQDGHHRGASSTMPQKVNPIGSEAVIGMAAVAGALSSSLLRAMEAGHERAAGEWQVEWHVVPQLAVLAAGALGTAGEVARGLVVLPEAMRANAEGGRGLIMAEAHMMRLAPALGRERAHDLVYEAAQEARRRGTAIEDALARIGAERDIEPLRRVEVIPPDHYTGQADAICDAALRLWAGRATSPVNRLVPRRYQSR